MIEKILLHIGKNQFEQREQVWLTPKTAGELQVVAAVQRHEKFAIFTIT